MDQDSRPRALLLDCYGTLVEEDAVLHDDIFHKIAQASPLGVRPAQVGVYYLGRFAAWCAESHGAAFRTQKAIERLTVQDTLRHFQADLDPDALIQVLFEYWMQPTLFPEVRGVLDRCALPTCVVSNIDTADLEAALVYHGLEFDYLVTSESARSYKPQGEMFAEALRLLGLSAGEVLHVGDSWDSDVGGARAQGIPVLWLNREGRALPEGDGMPDYVSADLRGILDILSGEGHGR